MTHLRSHILCYLALIPILLHAQPGKMDTLHLSGRLSGEERIFVWIPSHGLDSIRNVLYMHDGQNLFDPSTTWNSTAWMVRESLDSLINNRHIPPTLLVALPNTPFRHSEYTPGQPFRSLPHDLQQDYLSAKRPDGTPYYRSEVQADEYLKFLTTQVMPEIQRRYFQNPQSVRSFISGSSMGGLISWYAVLMYPDKFSGAACFSTHWPLIHEIPSPAGENYISFFHQKISIARNKKWYFDYGGRGIDTLYHPYQQAVDRLMEANFTRQNFKSLYFPDHNHSEIYWKQRFPAAIDYLVK